MPITLKQTKVGHIVEPGDAFTTTEVEKEKFSFTWDIVNFPDLKHKLFSPIFKGGPKGQNQWKLSIQPFAETTSNSVGQEEEEEDNEEEEGEEEKYIEFYLHLHKFGESNKDNEVNAEWKWSLLDFEQKVLETVEFSNDVFNGSSRSWGWDKWMSRSRVLNPAHGFLSQGHRLRIHCDIVTLLGVKHHPVSIKSVSPKNLDLKSAEKKMMEFLSLGKFSDVTLKTEMESFPCTKFILASHSPVFEAMFDSGMLESTKNTVKIVDFPAHIVRGMIQFLYTGKTEILEENAGELLSIADKYQIIRLKEKCKATLMKNLNVENAAETLILAHFYCPQILKPQVIYFINRMKKQVENTGGYKTMVKMHPVICAELYASLE